MRSIRVVVTAADLVGAFTDQRCCPLARALQRRLDRPDVSVMYTRAYIGDYPGKVSVLLLSRKAQDFREQFDKRNYGDPVTVPVTFYFRDKL